MLFVRRNYPLACLMQTAACLLLALLGLISTTDGLNQSATQILVLNPVFEILGRSFVIDSNLRGFIVILYGFLGAWSLSLYLFKVKSRVVPLGLTFLCLIISALAVEPFLYSALLIEMGVIVSVIMVADTNAAAKKGVLRYLIFFSLGMPFILLAGWYLAGGEITPVNEEQLIQATFLLGLGFVFWLGVFPFQSWIASIAEENRPTESMFLLILMPAVIVILLLKYLNGFVWLREYKLVFQALRLFGLMMVVTGSLWSFFQKKIGRLVSNLMITSSGLMLVAIGLDSPAGIYLTTDLVFSRLVVFFLLGWMMFVIKREKGSLFVASMKSLFSDSPILSLSVLISFFSIAGMPFTVGFPITQALYGYLFANDPRMNFLVILGMGIISFVFIRISFLIFQPPTGKGSGKFIHNSREKVFFGIFLGFLVLAGIFPQFFLSGVGGIVDGYEFLVK